MTTLTITPMTLSRDEVRRLAPKTHEWMSGADQEAQATFSLEIAIGPGTHPYLILHATHEGREVSEVVDIRPMVVDWLTEMLERVT